MSQLFEYTWLIQPDDDTALAATQAGQARIMEQMPAADWANRQADEISPLCLAVEWTDAELSQGE